MPGYTYTGIKADILFVKDYRNKNNHDLGT